MNNPFIKVVPELSYYYEVLQDGECVDLIRTKQYLSSNKNYKFLAYCTDVRIDKETIEMNNVINKYPILRNIINSKSAPATPEIITRYTVIKKFYIPSFIEFISIIKHYFKSKFKFLNKKEKQYDYNKFLDEEYYNNELKNWLYS